MIEIGDFFALSRQRMKELDRIREYIEVIHGLRGFSESSIEQELIPAMSAFLGALKNAISNSTNFCLEKGTLNPIVELVTRNAGRHIGHSLNRETDITCIQSFNALIKYYNAVSPTLFRNNTPAHDVVDISDVQCSTIRTFSILGHNMSVEAFRSLIEDIREFMVRFDTSMNGRCAIDIAVIDYRAVNYYTGRDSASVAAMTRANRLKDYENIEPDRADNIKRMLMPDLPQWYTDSVKLGTQPQPQPTDPLGFIDNLALINMYYKLAVLIK